MAAELVSAMSFLAGTQVPYFLLVFGIAYLGLSLLWKSGTNTAISVLILGASVAWFSTMGMSGFIVPISVVHAIAVGIVFVVLAKLFAG